MGQTTVDVVKERWPLDHVRFALLGLGSWYLSYVAFRNLKSFVPFVNHGLDDDQFASVDRWLFFGHDPAVVLHHLLGTGIAAHLLSGVYVAWLAFIPFTIAAALVFSRNVLGGAWFVTAMGIDWALGVATIMAFPTVGPIYDRPSLFTDLPHTWVTSLQQTMIAERAEVLADPWATNITQNIGAFASLHVGMMVTVCLIAHFLGLEPDPALGAVDLPRPHGGGHRVPRLALLRRLARRVRRRRDRRLAGGQGHADRLPCAPRRADEGSRSQPAVSSRQPGPGRLDTLA